MKKAKIGIFEAIRYLWRHRQRPKNVAKNVIWLDDVVMAKKLFGKEGEKSTKNVG